jgi:hypothetical protein
MHANDATTLHVPRRTLLLLLAASFVLAAAIVLCFVLPAEFHVDPTGVGNLTGVIRLAGPKQVAVSELPRSVDGAASPDAAARYYVPGEGPAYRTDFVDIPLQAGGTGNGTDELEYKVRMKAGGTLVYSWSVPSVASADELYFDFHGEAPASEPGAEGTVVEYLQATGTRSSGALVAPLDGVHGWYLQNQTEHPVVVHLKLSGFYDLVPPGEYGNERGIEANVPISD